MYIGRVKKKLSFMLIVVMLCVCFIPEVHVSEFSDLLENEYIMENNTEENQEIIENSPSEEITQDDSADDQAQITQENSFSQQSVVDFVKSKIGTSLDYDDINVATDVELIQSYFDYLEADLIQGNASDYRNITNEIPEGWSYYIQDGLLEVHPGDIVIWNEKDNQIGIAINYEDSIISYVIQVNQNNNICCVEQSCNALDIWGVIRPSLNQDELGTSADIEDLVEIQEESSITNDIEYEINDEKIVLEAQVSGSNILFSWNKLSEVSGYILYVSESLEGYYSKIGRIKENSYTADNIKKGIYYYKIRSFSRVNEEYQYGEYSDPLCVNMNVTGFSYELENENATLFWISEKDVSGYIVYESDNKNGYYSKLKRTSKTKYELNNLSKGAHYYKYRSYTKTIDGDYTYGPYSDILRIDMGVEKFEAIMGEDCINFYWPAEDVTGYIVYESDKRSSGFAKIKSIKTNYLSIPKPEKGTYFYKYRTYIYENGNYTYGEYSDPLCVNMNVTGFSYELENENATLFWIPEKDVSGYIVYESDNKDGYYSKLERTGKTKYELNNLSKGAHYYKYRSYTKTIDGDYAYGSYSDILRIDMGVEKFEAIMEEDCINFYWPAEDVTGYIVYESDKKSSGFAKIKSIKTNYLSIPKPEKGTYFYKYRTYIYENGNYTYGEYQDVLPVDIDTIGLCAEVLDNNISLRWPYAKDVTGYVIYEENQLTGLKTKIKSTKMQKIEINNVQEGVHYYSYRPYVLDAGIYRYGEYVYSSAVEVGVSCFTTVVNQNEVILKWPKIDDVDGYLLYQSINQDNGFSRIANVKNGITTKSLTGMEKGIYYFRMRSYNYNSETKAYTYGEYSDIVAALVENNTNSVNCFFDKDSEEIGFTVCANEMDVNHLSVKLKDDNLFPNSNEIGWFDNGTYKATPWIEIDSSKKYLTMSGSFNYAKWQFADSNGQIIDVSKEEIDKRRENSALLSNAITSQIEMPSDAKYVKVYYYYKGYAWSWISEDEPIYIVYGRLPAVQNRSCTELEIQLPDLEYGDSISYSGSGWNLTRLNGEQEILLDLPILSNIGRGSNLVIQGSSNMDFRITSKDMEINKEGIYGIKYQVGSSEITAERIGDAKNMMFNCTLDNAEMGLYENDFDLVYPWSEIRTCLINESDEIIYEGDKNFIRDGSQGDVFIEIPQFWVKREIVDGYEYVYISASEKDGFSIDPAFVSENGVAEKVYIAAYMSTLQDNTIASFSGGQATINNSYNDLLSYLNNKQNDSYKELDLVTLQMIQRLFLVETSILNCQSIFEGNTGSNFMGISAIADGINSNEINVGPMTEKISKFQVGDDIAIYDVPEGESYYKYFSGFDNSEEWCRKILSIRIDSSNNVIISFSGKAFLTENARTMISHLPNCGGRTDELAYCTASYSSVLGRSSFKYRNIENLWGNGCVIINGVYIEDEITYVKYPDNREVEIGYLMPIQSLAPNQSAGNAAAITGLGYDSSNPFIMLPTIVGSEKASSTNSFGDCLLNKKSNKKKYCTTGMTWDLGEYAGIFGYRFIDIENTKMMENTSRLIYR